MNDKQKHWYAWDIFEVIVLYKAESPGINLVASLQKCNLFFRKYFIKIFEKNVRIKGIRNWNFLSVFKNPIIQLLQSTE